MRVVLPLVIVLGVAGCGREAPAPAAVTRKDPASVAAPAQTADDSVAAVLQSSGKSPFSLRFAVENKLVVGKQGRVRLDIAGVPGPLAIALQAETLVIEPPTATVIVPDDGTTASQAIGIKPRTAGLAEIMVRLQPSGEDAKELVYAVPLLVENAASR